MGLPTAGAFAFGGIFVAGPRPSCSWEFEVKLDLPGLDFEEIYLVPIYAGESPIQPDAN
jgi:hypothetical protein